MSKIIANQLENVAGTSGYEVGTSWSFRNKIINGDKRVNQRNYTDTVLADGVYGYDRWKGHSSDANIEQVIEQENLRSGTYTISWVGGGTATVGATSGLSSGDSVTLTITGNVSVIVPKGATDIQLEEGSVATPFEQRDIGLELSLCQRYYWRGSMLGGGNGRLYSPANQTNLGGFRCSFNAMRVVPTPAIITPPSYIGCTSSGLVTYIDSIEERVTKDGTSGAYAVAQGLYEADAEIY